VRFFEATSSGTRAIWRGGPHTPAFLRKSVERIEWKGIVKRSWGKERQKSAKEREGIVPKRERWEAQGRKGRFGGSGL
jgi:hypothetical protein